ncbi:type III secretion system translocon subunit SctE [Robbsia sp. Bb-Pol-6]|uniref:Type III secretion system translocon subunit SctE n=1 Tax=Robbsia betulipollinis TaxID=2981849 RepID=A0ABT3ZMV5_9BURK|nr:type III secretion system translocon subunit SctE [Robbsia betulipollinis]MCY0387275.1 type III secretion system translocon subunit SctE [Robbsia betulipollinis]
MTVLRSSTLPSFPATGDGAADATDAPTTGSPAAGSSTPAAGSPAAADATLAAARAVLAALAASGFPGLEGTGAGATGGDGLDNANGAPSLAPASFVGNVEDVALLLQTAQDNLLNQRLASAKSAIDVASSKAAVSNKDQAQKVQDWIKNSEKAHRKHSGIMGWLTSIFKAIAAVVGVVVAAVATVATGGAAAPLLAVACIGLASATMSLASQISVAAGGPELSLTKLLTQGGTKLFEALGMRHDAAEKAGDIFAGVVGIGTGAALIDPGLVGTLATGVAKCLGAHADTLAILNAVVTTVAVIATAIAMAAMGNVGGAANAAAAATSTAVNTVKTAGAVMGGIGGVTQGVDQVVQGVQTLDRAKAEKAVGDARADMKENTATLMRLQSQMERSRDEIKKVVEQFQAAFERLSGMLENASQTSRQINSNFVPAGA